MSKNRCRLEGERYKGEFKGSRNKREVKERDYMWDRKRSYVWWEGTGIIIDKEGKKRAFGFSTDGTGYRQPRSLKKLIMNFEDDSYEEVRKEDEEELVDYVLESLVSRIENSKLDLPELIIMPHSRKYLVDRGLIPDEQGQIMLGLNGNVEENEG